MKFFFFGGAFIGSPFILPINRYEVGRGGPSHYHTLQFVSCICNFIFHITQTLMHVKFLFFCTSQSLLPCHYVFLSLHIIVSIQNVCKMLLEEVSYDIWERRTRNNPNQPAYPSSLVMFCLLESIVFESQGTQKQKVKTLASLRRYTD